MADGVKNVAAYVMVASGAALWGIIGIFVYELDQAGFSSLEIVAIRVLTASLILFLYVWIRYPKLLYVAFRDLHYFIGTGILSICFFNWSYFTAIKETNLSIAVILLYTGPAFVVLISRFLFQEPLTGRKILALIFTLIGASMVVELIPYTAGNISWYGFIVGVSSGFGYALYTIFSKFALKKYKPLTIILYTFIFASLFMVPFSGLFTGESFYLLGQKNVLIIAVGLGFFPTALAYLLYTEGLSRIEAGKASITTMFEPVTAALVGVFVYGDILDNYQILGLFLVLISVLIIQQRKKKMPPR